LLYFCVQELNDMAAGPEKQKQLATVQALVDVLPLFTNVELEAALKSKGQSQ
jgi:hypothetical protein